MCYKSIMRKWMRERMRRRKKPSENLSESTGKIGQAIDPSKPAPLMPSYEARPGTSPLGQEPDEEEDEAAEAFGNEGEGKIEVETQPESPSAPPGVADAATRKPTAKREPRGVVVLTIGLPGSGKTTWYKRRGVTPLSSDMLRSILFDSITEQRYQGLVFSTLRSLLRARLIAKMPWNYVDATNLSPHERRQWIKMARGFGYEVHAVFFDVPLEVCMDRNRKRERQVQEDVMKQMAARLRPPTFKEGFSKIILVRVKKSGEEAADASSV
ncbi:MAG TPA: ATP-binding protein [Terriglobales bacterium]|nr:ATP-binding protein [Terriglobales bacterium]